MSAQRKKGTALETAAAKYFSEKLGIEVRRNPLMADLDQGDLYGIRAKGKHFCVEVKNCAAYRLSQWMKELEREMQHSDTDIGCVLFHRNGVGIQNTGKQFVLMDVDILIRLLKGEEDE